MAAANITIECGFCLRKDEALPDPRVLPCSHVHCLECLTGYFEENNMLVCPTQTCGEAFETPPDSLPSHQMTGEDKWCDVCVKKMSKQEAVTYRTIRSKKLCDQHLELHDELYREHTKVSIEQRKTEDMRLEVRTCPQHEKEPYIMGCKHCATIACVRCIPELTECSKGGSHNLLPLDDLVSVLIDGEITSEMIAKEDQYEKLFKLTSKVRAEYDRKTAEMVEKIHQTRDSQINVLTLKYEQLETDVMEKRHRYRDDMADFMEDMVLKKWSQLKNQKRMIESRVKHSHQVDLVKGFADMKEEVQKGVGQDVPGLEIPEDLELKKQNENRDIELKVVPLRGFRVSYNEGVTPLKPMPKGLRLLKSVHLSSGPTAICHYKNYTYVGCYKGKVVRIDRNYQVHNSFISCSGIIESIDIYNDRIFLVLRSTPRAIKVYDMTGGHISSWQHPHHDWYCNILTIVDGQVVVADPSKKKLIIYSPMGLGEIIREVDCRHLTNNCISLTTVDNNSIIMANYNVVRRVNILTGSVMWTLPAVNKPMGHVRYGKYILLAANKNKTIFILDSSTGTIVSAVSDDAIAGGYVYNLEVVNDDILVVPHENSRKVLFYQMRY